MKQDSFAPSLTPEFVCHALRLNENASLIHKRKPVSGTSPISEDSAKIPFTAVCTDSRKIVPGCLFVALPGEKFDGHDYVEAAVKQGASGILCRKGFEFSSETPVHTFRVEDTQEGFRQVAARWRREFSIPTIVVAGANGKTTTKELLAAILSGKWPQVLKTRGSQNGFVGIPITLMELAPTHGAAVIEVGIDDIGAMEKHMALVSANAAVLTVIGPEHLEKLRDVPTVAREESGAFAAMAQTGGLTAINLDDPWIRPHWSTLKGTRKVGYSLKTSDLPPTLDRAIGEDFLEGQIKSGSGSFGSLHVHGRKFPESSFTLPLPGTHNAGNLLAAVAVAAGLGLTPEEISKGLESFQNAAGRSELRVLPGDTQVVCDYYNSSPVSMSAGLDLLEEVSRRGKGRRNRWICLGDMLELGPDEEKFHRDLAPKILDAGIEHVLLYGPRMRALEDELKKQSFQGELDHFDTHQSLALILNQNLKSGDALLIKGSRSMKMEEVWKLFEAAHAARG